MFDLKLVIRDMEMSVLDGGTQTHYFGRAARVIHIVFRERHINQ